RGGHCLKRDPGQPFPERSQHEHIRRAEQTADVAAPAEKMKTIAELLGGDTRLHLRPELSVTRQEEMGFGVKSGDAPRHFDEARGSLLRFQAGDHADEWGAVRNLEL